MSDSTSKQCSNNVNQHVGVDVTAVTPSALQAAVSPGVLKLVTEHGSRPAWLQGTDVDNNNTPTARPGHKLTESPTLAISPSKRSSRGRGKRSAAAESEESVARSVPAAVSSSQDNHDREEQPKGKKRIRNRPSSSSNKKHKPMCKRCGLLDRSLAKHAQGGRAMVSNNWKREWGVQSEAIRQDFSPEDIKRLFPGNVVPKSCQDRKRKTWFELVFPTTEWEIIGVTKDLVVCLACSNSTKNDERGNFVYFQLDGVIVIINSQGPQLGVMNRPAERAKLRCELLRERGAKPKLLTVYVVFTNPNIEKRVREMHPQQPVFRVEYCGKDPHQYSQIDDAKSDHSDNDSAPQPRDPDGKGAITNSSETYLYVPALHSPIGAQSPSHQRYPTLVPVQQQQMAVNLTTTQSNCLEISPPHVFQGKQFAMDLQPLSVLQGPPCASTFCFFSGESAAAVSSNDSVAEESTEGDVESDSASIDIAMSQCSENDRFVGPLSDVTPNVPSAMYCGLLDSHTPFSDAGTPYTVPLDQEDEDAHASQFLRANTPTNIVCMQLPLYLADSEGLTNTSDNESLQ